MQLSPIFQILPCHQAVATAQTKFEELFVSLKAAAEPGVSPPCFVLVAGALVLTNMRLRFCGFRVFFWTNRRAHDCRRRCEGCAGIHRGTFEGEAYGEGVWRCFLVDFYAITEHFSGKEADHATIEVLQQQDQLIAERAE